jgi:hypothetical protein
LKRLYQWLSERASAISANAASRRERRTVRTQVTVEHQGLTFLIPGGVAGDFEVCPFCGQKLDSKSVENAHLRLSQTPLSPEDFPAQGPRP